MDKMIQIENLIYGYPEYDEEGRRLKEKKAALSSVNLSVSKGEFVVILGRNGSGKSALAKQINALLYPDQGEVIVDGYSIKNPENILAIRKTAGMTFQNPDNQIVGNTVEEDVAFGVENLSLPSEEIVERVDMALKSVQMENERHSSPNRLSGGQKQRVAIAGVLAMQAKCIIFDESTAMLDPVGRKMILETAHRLNKNKGITILFITHYMEEAMQADRIYVMDKGRVMKEGTPYQIFKDEDLIQKAGLLMPETLQIYQELKKKDQVGDILKDLMFYDPLLSIEEYQKRQLQMIKESFENIKRADVGKDTVVEADDEGENCFKDSDDGYIDDNMEGSEKDPAKEINITLEGVSYIYQRLEATGREALKDISVSISSKNMTGIMGETGSGKSTLFKLISGLEKRNSGIITYDGRDMNAKKYSLYDHHKKVGIVFQYPEQQLFAETVLDDVMFGPLNFGMKKEEAKKVAREAMRFVGLDESYEKKSPFLLSGGEKRKVAIAGVLAYKPDFLLLDEPTAGLDPESREDMFALMRRYHEDNKGVVWISHSMEDLYTYADRILVMKDGRLLKEDSKEVFYDRECMKEAGLDLPIRVQFDEIMEL